MIAGMKRLTFLWGALLFMVTLMMLYMMLDTMSMAPGQGKMDSEMLTLLETKLARMEKDMNDNRLIMQQIKQEIGPELGILGGAVQNMGVVPNTDKKEDNGPAAVQINPPVQKYDEEMYSIVRPKEPEASNGVCEWVTKAKSSVDINVHSLMSSLAFDNPDGGAWKQGWKVTYADNRWHAENKLRIILIPHSHCDPGWIKTYDVYYRTQTKLILNSFVPKLEENPKYKFMFSEMSYLSTWWSELDDGLRNRVKKLIANKQFEISTGGWVMSDEANAHYFAMLDQLIEGHQWLNSTLGYIPKSGWSIDPFGYSSTMAYLLKRSKFDSMLIQRVHYAIKKHLARKTSLEFMWRQHWDTEGSTDMYTHLMPFYSYDIPHTCGPEPAVCCQFDFRRLPGSSYRCPWNIDPKAITEQNVAERSAIILDQWRKKATLYKTNVVLVPLGDDFRYMTKEEFDLQFNNYEKIFKHINDHPELGAEAQFGTLSDYFNAVYEETKTRPGHAPPDFPSLSGDFFSYADRDDHYWSGYYTSRPLQKNLDRVLEHNLRSAEIILSLAQAQARKQGLTNFPSRPMAEKIEVSRRALALFQHHDAITGTAKDNVVEDYGDRLLHGLHQAKRVIVECSEFLLMAEKERKSYVFNDASGPDFGLDELRETHTSLPVKSVLGLKKASAGSSTTGLPVIIYNSLAQPRSEVVTLHVDSPWVQVTGPDGNIVHTQLEPVWSSSADRDALPASDVFAIKFVADVPGLSVSRYQVHKVEQGSNKYNHVAKITFLNRAGTASNALKSDIFPIEQKKEGSDFSVETDRLRASFSGVTGRLKTVKDLESGSVQKAEVEFIKYGTRAHQDKSGAYLFLPDGDAKPLETDRPGVIRIVQGPLGSKVTIFTQFIQHTVHLHNTAGIDGSSVEMSNTVDIRNSRNMEVGMRIHTGVENKEQIFYSDLNGFQMQQRKYYQKLTLQGNVYPMPTMAYLQDSEHRVSVLASQSSGVANLVQGAIDVMFDRRLNQDDNRGVGQGVTDNHPTPSRYRLLFETRKAFVKEPNPESSFPSLLGQLSSLSLIHPMFVMPYVGRETAVKGLSNVAPLVSQGGLPCEMHLLNLRLLLTGGSNPEMSHIPKENSLLLVRHLPSDCSFPSPGLSCSAGNGQVNPSTMFTGFKLRSSVVTSLTMTTNLAELKPGTAVQIPPMEILALKMELE